jgi:hypothetical protein
LGVGATGVGAGSVALLLAARSAGAALAAWWASELVAAGKLLISALLLLGCLIVNVEVLTGTRLGDEMTDGHSRNQVGHGSDDMPSLLVRVSASLGIDALFALHGKAVLEIVSNPNLDGNNLLKLKDDSRNNMLVCAEVSTEPSFAVGIEIDIMELGGGFPEF